MLAMYVGFVSSGRDDASLVCDLLLVCNPQCHRRLENYTFHIHVRCTITTSRNYVTAVLGLGLIRVLELLEIGYFKFLR